MERFQSVSQEAKFQSYRLVTFLKKPNHFIICSDIGSFHPLLSLFAINCLMLNANFLPVIILHWIRLQIYLPISWSHVVMLTVKFRFKQIQKNLQKPEGKKSSILDKISALVLANCASELSPILNFLFQLSYNKGICPYC